VNVKGFHKTSLIDYPGEISSVIFTGGCNLRCRFCHNSELALDDDNESYLEDDILSTLEKRRKLIDAVVITGGEPTLRSSLYPFLQKLKKMQFNIKLDTNGSDPSIIRRLIDDELIDYIAVDIKTSPAKYRELVGTDINPDLVKQTIDILRSSSINYELRSTCIPGYIDIGTLTDIREWIGSVKKYYLQQFRNDKTLDPSFSDIKPHSKETMRLLCDYVSSFAETCELRGF
jgi:pyruvate formate lyase activating enzyme